MFFNIFFIQSICGQECHQLEVQLQPVIAVTEDLCSKELLKTFDNFMGTQCKECPLVVHEHIYLNQKTIFFCSTMSDIFWKIGSVCLAYMFQLWIQTGRILFYSCQNIQKRILEIFLVAVESSASDFLWKPYKQLH